MTSNLKNRITSVIRYMLFVLFFYTLYSKLSDLHTYELSLVKSRLIPDNQVNFVQYSVLIAEAIAVVLLLLRTYLKGLYFSLILLSLFTFYLIALNVYSFYAGCSCGGIFSSMDFGLHVSVNIFFVLLNIIAIILYRPSSE